MLIHNIASPRRQTLFGTNALLVQDTRKGAGESNVTAYKNFIFDDLVRVG